MPSASPRPPRPAAPPASQPADPPAPRRGFPVRSHHAALLGVVAALAALVAWPARDALRPAAEVAVRPVLALADAPEPPLEPEAEPRPGGRAFQAAGWIEPDPYRISVSALADGVVEAVHVLEGEAVERGQLLVTLDAADARLTARRARAGRDAAAAALARERSRLAAAETHWDEPVERERAVAVAAAALEGARARRDRLGAELERAEAEAARARIEADRLRDAAGGRAATPAEVELAEATEAAMAAAVRVLRLDAPARAAQADARAAELAAAERAAELRVTERAELDAARAAADEAAAALASAEAALAEAELGVERMTLRSPIDGLVLARLVGPGDKLRLGMDGEHSAHAVHLYDPTRLQVRVDVPLADAAQAAVGQACEVVADVAPDRSFAAR